MVVNIKYRFSDFPKVFLTNKNELWQESYTSGLREFPAKKLNEKLHQGKLKFIINRR